MCEGWEVENSVDQNSFPNFTAVLPNVTLNPAVTAPVLSQTTKSPDIGSANITISGLCHHNSTEVNCFINTEALKP